MAKFSTIALGTMTALALVASLSAAHSRAYVASEVLGLCFTDGGDLQDVPSVAGTCWNGAHVAADSNGQATVSVTDAAVSPVGAFVCQDLNADVLCGGDGELSTAFCGSATLTNTANGGLWDDATAESLWIFVNGPVSGVLDAAAPTQCGTFSSGTTGTADHS